jgi:methylmalonyl-CoA mutase
MVQQLAYSLAHVMNILIEFGYQSTNSYSGWVLIIFCKTTRIAIVNLVAKEYNHDLECHLLVSPTKRNPL